MGPLLLPLGVKFGAFAQLLPPAARPAPPKPPLLASPLLQRAKQLFFQPSVPKGEVRRRECRGKERELREMERARKKRENRNRERAGTESWDRCREREKDREGTWKLGRDGGNLKVNKNIRWSTPCTTVQATVHDKRWRCIHARWAATHGSEMRRNVRRTTGHSTSMLRLSQRKTIQIQLISHL